MAEIVVAGAGIVGISTAIWLQRAGHTVTVVDREGPAAGTSYGNAGVLASGAEFGTYDPLYADNFATVVRCKNHGRISDPGAYVKALAAHFQAEGGTLIIAEVTDAIRDGEVTKGFVTSKGDMRGDHAVMALGAWSKPLGRKLGLTIDLESERGYHIELVNPSHMPKAPMMVVAGKFVITPMEGRIRCAGVVEFGGLKKPASRAPFDLLKRHVAQILPDVRYDRVDEWMGHRPAPADSLPLIGATNDTNSAFTALGHQHVGLTAGPKTGRIIAGLIDGTGTNMDLAPFSPQKYS